jgi:hypothetical protein
MWQVALIMVALHSTMWDQSHKAFWGDYQEDDAQKTAAELNTEGLGILHNKYIGYRLCNYYSAKYGN